MAKKFELISKKFKEVLLSLPNSQFFLQKDTQRIILGLVVYFLVTFILVVNLSPEFSLEVGQRAPRDIKAPRSADYVNNEATKKKRKEATKKVKKIYKYSPEVNRQMESLVKEVFLQTHKVATEFKGNQKEKQHYLNSLISLQLSPKILNLLINLSPFHIEQIRDITLQIIQKITNQEIKEDTSDLEKAREDLIQEVRMLNLQNRYKEIIKNVGLAVLRPNSFYDERETEKKKKQISKDIKPITGKISRGEIIVRKDEIITSEQIDKLEALGLRHPKTNYLRVIGIGIFNLIVLAIVIIYLIFYQKNIYSRPELLTLLSLVFIVALASAKLINNPLLPGYQTILPLTAAGMLIGILLNVQLAFLICGILSLQLGIIMNMEVRFVLLSLISCWVGVCGMSRVHQRSDIVRAGAWVSLINFLVIVSLALLAGEGFWPTLVNSSLGVVNGIGAAILSIGGLFFLEKPFGISTPIQLMELANPHEPLLKRLMVETPGTYNHSVYVANLAEAGASAISANPLLARVGAYYHDIGKIKRPYFFVENQINVDNLHEKMSPALSALIIKAHVSDGIELAQEYGLPPKISDFIREHHGTSLISFFYQKDLANGKDEQELEETHRYDGPKPQSKETAVVMLADAVEAAVRAMSNHSSENIQATVKKIIRSKFEDGQLDESELTFKDLNKITNAFIRLLEGMFHPRLEYPEEVFEGLK